MSDAINPRPRLLFQVATIGLLVIALAFGGASRVNALRLALVELAALPLLVMTLDQLFKPDQRRHHRWALGLLAAVVVIPLAQLVPMPPAVWTRLPGREQLVLAMELVQLPLTWIPISLTPVQTFNAVLALMPPVAIFLAFLLNKDERLTQRALLIALAFAFVCIGLGVLQLTTGNRLFYPYQSTQSGFVSGLFANRNHFATLLLVVMPFTAAILGRRAARHPDQRHVYGLLLATGIAVSMLALLAAQSRAGVLLFPLALVFSIIIGWQSAGLKRPSMPILVGGGIALVIMIGVGATFLPPILDRFNVEGQPEARFENWPLVMQASQTYLPIGSGVGSFDPVFRTIEPLERLDSTFFNHAHNEYLEVWLETGWLGVGLVAVFLWWWARRSWEAWFQATASGRSLRRAASVAILIVLIHSAFDYPLRTEALAVLFAMAAAILEGAGSLAVTAPRRSRRKSV